MNLAVTLRPRSLANVLLDLKEARTDLDLVAHATDPDAEDRATEAETRLDDLREEFESRFAEATGLSLLALLKAREEALL